MNIELRGIVGGRIDLQYRNPGKANWVELFETVRTFQQQVYIEKHHYATTANLFTSKLIFDHIGPFMPIKSTGDYEWGKKCYQAGYPLVYADNARIKHPTRGSLQSILQRYQRITGGRIMVWRQSQGNLQIMARAFEKILLPLRLFRKDLKDPRLAGFTAALKVMCIGELMGMAFIFRVR